jgi:hypothetical protein
VGRVRRGVPHADRDTLRLWAVGPHGPEVMSCQLVDACVTAGLLVVAVGPWAPGGASALGTAQPRLRWRMEGAAAFIPLTVCTATALGYVLAPPARDPVPLLVGGTALLSLWARQRFLPRENSRNDDRVLVRLPSPSDVEHQQGVAGTRDADQHGVV